MDDWDAKYTGYHHVVDTGANVLGIVELGNADLTSFPGQKGTKDKENALIHVQCGLPICLVLTITV